MRIRNTGKSAVYGYVCVSWLKLEGESVTVYQLAKGIGLHFIYLKYILFFLWRRLQRVRCECYLEDGRQQNIRFGQQGGCSKNNALDKKN